MAYSANHPMGMCQHCTGLGTDLVLKEDLLFDTTKTLREGAIRFSQFSNGWQTYLYQANPKINADKKLGDFSAAEWGYLKYGEREPDGTLSKKQVKVEIRSNNTGHIDKVDYEGVIPRFERLYLKRDITKLKKNLQDEILSFVEKGGCPHCGGTGLNPKALESKINGKNIVDYGEMTAAELLAEMKESTRRWAQALHGRFRRTFGGCRHRLPVIFTQDRYAFGRRNPTHKTCERTSQKGASIFSTNLPQGFTARMQKNFLPCSENLLPTETLSLSSNTASNLLPKRIT